MMTRNSSLPTRTPQRAVVRLSLCALLLLPLAALAGQGDNGPFTLKMKFKQGETHKYKMTMQMHMTMNMAGQPQPMNIPVNSTTTMEQKVTKALPNGGAEVTMTILSQQTTTNGQATPSPQMPPTTMTYDATGKVTGFKGGPAGAPGMSMMNGMFNSPGASGMGTIFPSHPVKPGDTWTQTLKMPTMGMNGTAKYTFIKVENIGKFKTARIRMALTTPMNMMMDAQGKPTTAASKAMMTMLGTVAATGDNNVSIEDGKLVRMSSNANMKMTMKVSGKGAPPGAGNMKMSMKMTMAMELMQ